MELKRPEEAFVSDITYLKTKERTHYLVISNRCLQQKNNGL